MHIHQVSKHSRQQYWRTGAHCSTSNNFPCISGCVGSMNVCTYACLLHPEIHTNQVFSIIMLLTNKRFEIIQDEIIHSRFAIKIMFVQNETSFIQGTLARSKYLL